MKKNESEKKLEKGKDYVNVNDNNLIVIDRAGDFDNKGFYGEWYKKDIPCNNCGNWREATEKEVIEAFKKHLIHRYGKDWETMKVKEKHPSLVSGVRINDGLWDVEISKENYGWDVRNKNGLLYCDGIWVERLEEEEKLEKIHIKEAIKENTVIHCETEEEAERILGMAHELGYKWTDGEYYIGNRQWIFEKSKTCYRLIDGVHSNYDYFKTNNYTIIPSTQIADFEEKKTTDWSPAPDDIKEMKKNKETDRCFQLKIKALLEGLEVQNIEKFMREAEVADYRNYGKSYVSAVKSKIEEKKPLFVTEDGVGVYDIDSLVFVVKGDFLKIQMFALAFSQNKNDMKSFFHESNADEYILWNKPLLSLNEIDETIEMYTHEFEELIKLAKKRSKK